MCIDLQEGCFDLQEALQAIHMRQETLKEQLAHARSKGEETVGRNIQVTDCIMTVCLFVCGRGMLSGASLTPSSCLSTNTRLALVSYHAGFRVSSCKSFTCPPDHDLLFGQLVLYRKN